MKNLLRETRIEIEGLGKTEGDIEFVGVGGLWCEWVEFARVADVEYNSGYGAAEVPTDTVIVFTDGTWLERWEYDGSEGWTYKEPPRRDIDRQHQAPVAVIGELWPNGHDLWRTGERRA